MNQKPRKTKKLVSLLLAVIMLLSTMPLSIVGFAEETEYAVGDIIEFGSYPQTEITDENITVELEALAGPTDKWTSYNYMESQNTPGDYMKYKDVEYNGEKYRGVNFTKYRPGLVTATASTSASSCSSMQSSNGYTCDNIYWFKYEPIQWVVLEAGTGGLAMSKNIIDAQAYSDTCYGSNPYYSDADCKYYSNNWEHSTIRAWLNSTFINTAFTCTQQTNIVKTTISTYASSTSVSEFDSADTSDKIFLLSKTEVLNEEYGFEAERIGNNTKSNWSTTREKTGTDYAKAQGLMKQPSKENAYWRTRTGHGQSDYTSWVTDNGSVYGVNNTSFAALGVVAALYFKSYNPADDSAEQTTYKVGDIIKYGSYPQTEITDENITEELETLAGSTDNWTSYNYMASQNTVGDYMKYTDVEYNGAKYRGVYLTKYRNEVTAYEASTSTSAGKQAGNGYTCGENNIYWFKFEPIQWVILEAGTGGLAVSQNVLDSQAYCDTMYGSPYAYSDADCTYYCSNWEHSTIRTWLNSTFVNTAFTLTEQSNIVKTTISTPSEGSSSNNADFDSENTTDKIFLLTKADIMNEAYGFDDNPARRKTGTDYAEAQGLYVGSSTKCAYWRLRSSAGYALGTFFVTEYGSVLGQPCSMITSYGVVPALYLASYNYSGTTQEDSHTYKSVITVPTCTEKGYTTHICTKCEYSYVDTYVDARGHRYVDHEARSATCTEIGWNAYQTCRNCDYTTYEEIAAKGHDYVDHEAKPATCTEVGWNAYQTCNNCDYTTYEEIAALGHNIVKHEAKAPTCAEVGWNEYEACSRCDYSTYSEIPTTEHTKSDWIIRKEPTCTEKGYKVKICTVCETVLYTCEISANGHMDSDSDGYCNVCGEKNSENCQHMCHKGGIRGLLWKIINIFNMLLGVNEYCSCGVRHWKVN